MDLLQSLDFRNYDTGRHPAHTKWPVLPRIVLAQHPDYPERISFAFYSPIWLGCQRAPRVQSVDSIANGLENAAVLRHRLAAHRSTFTHLLVPRVQNQIGILFFQPKVAAAEGLSP
jgi:hypothetical protein